MKVTSGAGGRELSPAMRRWKEMIDAGYTIQPVIGRSSFRRTVWRPGLFNADGGFVQNVRQDTFERLVALGIIRLPGGTE